MSDELTPEEKEALKNLPRERMPGAGLEEVRHVPRQVADRRRVDLLDGHEPRVLDAAPDRSGQVERGELERAHFVAASVGAGFAVLGIACIVNAFQREREIERALREGRFALMNPRSNLVLTVAGVILCGFTLLLIVANP